MFGNDNTPETFKLVVVTDVPLALVNDRLVMVPTVVRFGNDVEAAVVKYVLDASAWKPISKNDEVVRAG